MPKRRNNDDALNSPVYRKWVEDIKKVIKDAASQGIDLCKRQDLLHCRACGVFEDQLRDGRRVICHQHEDKIEKSEFIVLDMHETSHRRGKCTYFKTRYDFICTSCGAQQELIVKERFDDA